MKSFAKGFAILLCAAWIGLAVAGCYSPTSSGSSSNTSKVYMGQEGTGGLSFTFNFDSSVVAGTRALTSVSGVGYLSVQLYSPDLKTTLFQSATVSGSTASLSFSNIIPGIWYANARLYDSQSAGNLRYFGSTQVTVVGGATTTASLPVYAVGSLSVAVSGGIYADSVSVVDTGGNTSATVAIGSSYQLMANLMASEGVPNQEVMWVSSNPRVATVDQSGLVMAKSLGSATITATAKFGGAIASFALTVVEGYVGTWQFTESFDGTFAIVWELGASNYTEYSWDPSGYTAPSSVKGTVQNLGDGSILLTPTTELDVATGSNVPTTPSMQMQVLYKLNADGSLSMTILPEPDYPVAMQTTAQKVATFVHVTAMTSSLSGTLYGPNSYPLGISFVPTAPTVPVFMCYAIIDSLGNNASSIGYVSGGTFNLYSGYPGSYTIRLRSLSDPAVTLDIPIVVGS